MKEIIQNEEISVSHFYRNQKASTMVILMKGKLLTTFFWKMVKTFLSYEVASKAENTLVKNEKVIDKERKATELLNTFFSNIVGNLNIAEYRTCNPLANEISDPALKAIVKYRNHPSILKIGEACKKIITFSFSCVDKGENFK